MGGGFFQPVMLVFRGNFHTCNAETSMHSILDELIGVSGAVVTAACQTPDSKGAQEIP